MIFLNVVFCSLTVIHLDPLADAVGHEGFVDYGITLVFFVCQYGADGSVLPFGAAARCRYSFSFKIAFYSVQALTGEIACIYFFDNLGFLGNDFNLTVCAFRVAEEVLALERHDTLLGTLCFAPFDIGADIFGFALGYRAVDGDVKFRGRINAVDALFLEEHIYIDISELSCRFDHIESVSGEAADGFDDDHVDFALVAEAKHFIEFVTLFHACSRDALIGKDADKRPFRLGADAFLVMSFLHLVAV